MYHQPEAISCPWIEVSLLPVLAVHALLCRKLRPYLQSRLGRYTQPWSPHADALQHLISITGSSVYIIKMHQNARDIAGIAKNKPPHYWSNALGGTCCSCLFFGTQNPSLWPSSDLPKVAEGGGQGPLLAGGRSWIFSPHCCRTHGENFRASLRA